MNDNTIQVSWGSGACPARVVRVRAEDDNGRRMVTKVKLPKSDAGVRDVAIPPHLLAMVGEHLLNTRLLVRPGCCFQVPTASTWRLRRCRARSR